ncbi:hypothetical protein ACNOYE_39780 [Nannocystaceae bacterium ST9]
MSDEATIEVGPDGSPLTWARSHGFLAMLLRPGEIDEARWQRLATELESTDPRAVLLIMLGTVDLPPARRRWLQVPLAGRELGAAIDSVIGRGIVTALTWAGLPVSSFPLSRVREAISTIVPADEQARGRHDPWIDESLALVRELVRRSDPSGRLDAMLETAARFGNPVHGVLPAPVVDADGLTTHERPA